MPHGSDLRLFCHAFRLELLPDCRTPKTTSERASLRAALYNTFRRGSRAEADAERSAPGAAVTDPAARGPPAQPRALGSARRPCPRWEPVAARPGRSRPSLSAVADGPALGAPSAESPSRCRGRPPPPHRALFHPRRGTSGVPRRRAHCPEQEMAPAPLLTRERLAPRGTKWRRRRPRTQHSRAAMKPRGGAAGA